MDLLDYAEAQGRRNADFSLQTLELLSKRGIARQQWRARIETCGGSIDIQGEQHRPPAMAGAD